jgi:hypothetical protein
LLAGVDVEDGRGRRAADVELTSVDAQRDRGLEDGNLDPPAGLSQSRRVPDGH